MPSYTNLSLFLIISSENYISDPKILTKGAATVVFAQGSSFNKDQHTLLNLHVMLRLCRLINFSLLFVKLPLFSKIKLISSFFIREKNNFKYFLFGGICKSRLYSVDISTDILILDSLLVHVY